MSWTKVKLGDIAELSNGINFDKNAYSKGVKLIGVSNFGNRFSPEYDSLEEIKEDVVRKSDLLHTGDIVFVRSNGNKELVGRCMLIDNLPEKVTYSGFCIRARFKDTTKNDPVFWTYHFKNMAFRKAMSGTAIGANIQNLSQGRLSIYEATVPDIEDQRKIAAVLSVYDKLIENNQKQINLLEEAAQRLYKEWFVDLRFPGCEDVAVVDGVPEGWQRKQIVDVSSVLRRGISLKYNDNAVTLVINQKCIRQSIVDMKEARKQEKAYPEELNLCDGDTVICSTGSGSLGRVGQVFGDKENVTFDSHVTLVRAKKDFGIQLLYHTIKANQSYLMGMGKGSTNQLELSRNVIQELKIWIPTPRIQDKFEQLALGIHDKVKVLNGEIIRLAAARDILLPKLMNGEIEV